MGSGKYGQTYLYWKQDHLYQLPVSYLSYRQKWALSPGYSDGTADFARAVTTRCLDCHTTEAQHVPGTVNRYLPNRTVLGLHCVRCHGDATKHVAFHREHPDSVTAEHLTSLSSLTPRQLNELCAQCHSGAGELLQPAFSYRPGDPLEHYLQIDQEIISSEVNSPHSANQLQRLIQSMCYQNSDQMTCVTCHNPHRHERNEQVVFADRCLSCHATQSITCPERSILTASLWETHCVGCLMPQRTDPNTFTEMTRRITTPKLRDHRIAVWPEISRKVRGF